MLVMKKIDFGKNIKNIRLSLNLTQLKFGELIGVSGSCIQHWETNYTEPDLTALRKMKEVFGISYDEIIDGI